MTSKAQVLAEGLERMIRIKIVDFHLAAVADDGTALYKFRNWRSGGSDHRIRKTDGTIVNGNDYGLGRSGRPLPPPVGRWHWVERF